jgi:phosphonate transport system substrate-binding protein
VNPGCTPRLAAPAALLWVSLAAPAWAAAGGDPPFRLIASLAIMADVNENDVRAALRVWAGTFEKQMGMGVDLEHGILATSEQLVRAVREGQVEGFAATVLEYLQVADYVDPAVLVLDESYALGGEQYVILVHQEGGIHNFRELRGRKLTIHQNATTCLASAWLQTLVAETGAGRIEDFLGAVTRNNRVSKGVVLPVFFRQTDACLVTRRAYETMCELNPQLQKRLRMIETSPKLIPIVMAFHKDCAPDRRKRFAQGLLALHESPVGQQLLALFQGRRLLLRDRTSLVTTIELVNSAERVKARAAGGKR